MRGWVGERAGGWVGGRMDAWVRGWVRERGEALAGLGLVEARRLRWGRRGRGRRIFEVAPQAMSHAMLAATAAGGAAIFANGQPAAVQDPRRHLVAVSRGRSAKPRAPASQCNTILFIRWIHTHPTPRTRRARIQPAAVLPGFCCLSAAASSAAAPWASPVCGAAGSRGAEDLCFALSSHCRHSTGSGRLLKGTRAPAEP